MSRLLEDGLEALGFAMSNKQIAQLNGMMDSLEIWGKKHNLTSLKTRDDFIVYHILDSLSGAKYFNRYNCVLDIGTGAGFPGIPLAILFPEKTFHLLDANTKKIAYLRNLIYQLKLDNVQLHHCRVQDFNNDLVEVITSRALADPYEIARMTKHMVQKSALILYVSKRDKLLQGFESHEVHVPFSSKQHYVLLVRDRKSLSN